MYIHKTCHIFPIYEFLQTTLLMNKKKKKNKKIKKKKKIINLK